MTAKLMAEIDGAGARLQRAARVGAGDARADRLGSLRYQARGRRRNGNETSRSPIPHTV